MIQLTTRWGEKEILSPENTSPLPEYPRPMMVRTTRWESLNGSWDYAITEGSRLPKRMEGKILVPFSPEAYLSGVHRQLQPAETLWYHRTFQADRTELDKNHERLLLHFGAVDQVADVFVNRQMIRTHVGGYLPFTADVTPLLKDGENELSLRVKDESDTGFHARGKQKLEAGGMFYTATSGIWQSVWLEVVPALHIHGVRTTVFPDHHAVQFTVQAVQGQDVQIEVLAPAMENGSDYLSTDPALIEKRFDNGTVIAKAEGQSKKKIRVSLSDVRLWGPGSPWLYWYRVTMGKDVVYGYFGLRTVTVENDGKFQRICINHRPVFEKGVLDQGYWPDGILTAPSDEAMIWDITKMKEAGFNMVRKHVKIEPERWYYHCDRLGILVWQDMVNGGGTYHHWYVTDFGNLISQTKLRFADWPRPLLARQNPTGRREYIREMQRTIRHLYNHPAIIVWVLFNEGWGQFNANEMTRIAKHTDSTRLIDEASGWFDQGQGDLRTVHNYFFPKIVYPEKHRAFALSEIGGFPRQVKGHTAMLTAYGYGSKKLSEQDLNRKFRKLCEKMQRLEEKGLCGYVYTQWTDVEGEVNGIYTYDRKVKKIEEKP